MVDALKPQNNGVSSVAERASNIPAPAVTSNINTSTNLQNNTNVSNSFAISSPFSVSLHLPITVNGSTSITRTVSGNRTSSTRVNTSVNNAGRQTSGGHYSKD